MLRTSKRRRFLQSQNFRVQLPRQFLAVGAAFVQLRKANGRANRALAQEIDQVRHQRHVFPVTNFFPHVAVVDLILDEARKKGMGLPRGRFEQ